MHCGDVYYLSPAVSWQKGNTLEPTGKAQLEAAMQQNITVANHLPEQQ